MILMFEKGKFGIFPAISRQDVISYFYAFTVRRDFSICLVSHDAL